MYSIVYICMYNFLFFYDAGNLYRVTLYNVLSSNVKTYIVEKWCVFVYIGYTRTILVCVCVCVCVLLWYVCVCVCVCTEQCSIACFIKAIMDIGIRVGQFV